MRFPVLVLALCLSLPLAAQEQPVKKKKPTAAKKAKAHQKPTPEQIRKFNELQKKQ
jgi:hypothetical protein